MVETRKRKKSQASSKPEVEVARPKNLKVSIRRTKSVTNTSSSTSRLVKVVPPQKEQVSTISTTPSEIPESLYDLIQNAARASKSLKLNSNDTSAKRELEYLESEIHVVSTYCKYITEELPIDWKYDPKTSFKAHIPKPLTPPKPKTEKKKKTKKDIQITWSSPNYHGGYPLNKDELEVWTSFREREQAETQAHKFIGVDEYLNLVDKDDKVFHLLGKFAVEFFNRSCQMYVNKDEDSQVSGLEFMECKFCKYTSEYVFYMTIEAIEQGIPGVYETRVECDTKDGAKTLMNFTLTDRKPKCNRPWVKPCLEPEVEYETVQDGSSDPQEYYELTGMVHRETKGGGFNYHNPRFSPHTIAYTINYIDQEALDFVPNVSQPL